MALAEPRIWSQVSGDLPPEHPWAFVDVTCLACGATLNPAGDSGSTSPNLRTWVETVSGGYCLPCFTSVALDDGGLLKDDMARGRVPTLIEKMQEAHPIMETEHGICCFACSALAADSDYRVLWPCPSMLRAYDVEATAPAKRKA